MQRLPSQHYPVIHNRVSVNVGGEVHMYCYYDGDEPEISQVISKHVACGKLPALAGFVLKQIVFLEEFGQE